MNKRLLAILAFGILIRLLFLGFTADDAYITFTYSKNLVEGNGFVFNPGENVLGITNPLYGLVISAGMFFGLNPIIFSKLIGLASFVVIFFVGWNFLRERSKVAAYAFAIFFAVDHYSSKWFMSGMETPLFSLVVFLSCIYFLKGRETLAGILAGLSIFIRPEGGFLIPVLLLFSKDRKKIIPGIFITASFFIFCQMFYDFPIPHSIYAKIVLGSKSMSNILESGYHLLNFVIKEPLSAMFLSFSSLNYSILLVFPLFVLVSHLILQAPVFFWYYAPYYPLLFFASAIGVSRFSKLVKKEFSKMFLTVLFFFVVLHQLSFAARELYLQREDINDMRIYKEFALNVSDDEGSIVIGDIGIVSYYSNHYIFDTAGLVSPKSLNCSLEGRLKECVAELEPDYFVTKKGQDTGTWPEELNCTDLVAKTSLLTFYKCS